MNFLLAGVIAVGLLAVAILHFMWACGSTFPAADEKTLAVTVAGFRGVQKMPPRLASLIVSAALLFCVLLPLGLVFQNIAGGWLLKLLAGFIGAVFVLRGVMGFTPWWRSLTPEQPFARLDRKYYSPFCLFVGISLFVLTARVLT